MIKGKNQHVMPCDHGWCVVDEANQAVATRFETFEEALAYASDYAALHECGVLVHETASEPNVMSTVPLPQRQAVPQSAASRQNDGEHASGESVPASSAPP